MAQRINIKQEIYWRLNRKKELKKIRYNRKVKMQFFILYDLVLLKNLTLYFRKLIEQLCRSFIIDSFSRNHSALYVLKILDRRPALNTHYNNYLRIFYLQKQYLRLVDKGLIFFSFKFYFYMQLLGL